ncbi:MAG: hypothetical protein QOI83_1457 [Streptomycetaceae bacterium]|jgi:type VII secretion protein EccB|nr:hypothetical protein [Streptomycetaceae bacterium]
MATRRDELNAYSFARKRTVAAFLQPSPHGSEEAAPRPLKTVGPSLVVAVMIVVGFSAWGVLKPTAPKGWDEANAKVIVGDESTTRYVVLMSGKTKMLHPVLNLASARLLLDPKKYGVIKVKESVLDNSGIQQGATIGIPYAPDRMPSQSDAKTPKYWALCETAGAGTDQAPQKAVFVLNKHDQVKVEGPNRLTDKEALYVQSATSKAQYLVSADGTAYLLGEQQQSEQQHNLLSSVVFGPDAKPQTVTDDWLATLNQGGTVTFPQIDGVGGTSTAANLAPKYAKVGLVLKAGAGTTYKQYVVLKDKVAPITDFTAQMLLGSAQTRSLYTGAPAAVPVALSDINPQDDNTMTQMGRIWPQNSVIQANKQDTGARKVSCSVYHGTTDPTTKEPVMTTWAGTNYPKDVVQSGTRTYVSPGSGLFYQQVTGTESGGGSVYLVTDTGLRYSVSYNPHTNQTSGSTAAANGQDQSNAAQAKLGYDKNTPVPVPKVWSDLLALGPALDVKSAGQTQGS